MKGTNIEKLEQKIKVRFPQEKVAIFKLIFFQVLANAIANLPIHGKYIPLTKTMKI